MLHINEESLMFSTCRFLFLFAFALLLAVALPGIACYSGLLVIPTADTVGANQYCLDCQVDGATTRMTSDTYLLNTQFGVGDRLEVGVDADLAKDADARFFFNGKYVLDTRKDGTFAVAAGVCNCTTSGDLDESPYLVATRDFTAYRGTAGVMRIDGRTAAIIGVDKTLDDRTLVTADYTTGEENGASAAFCYDFNDSTSIMAGVMLPNSGSVSDARYSVHLSLTGSYRHTTTEE
jgi:hypothetical protein